MNTNDTLSPQAAATAPSYDVGYKKPPKHTQFKKGQSGNPLGRKKGSRNRLSYALPPEQLKYTLLAEAYREITVNEPGGSKTMPTARAIMRSLMIQAAKGKIGAQRLATELIFETERSERKEAEARATWLIDYKQHWDAQLANGYDGEPPVPHPDQIILDSETGHMEIRGPLSKEAKEKHDFYAGILKLVRLNLAASEVKLAGSTDDAERTQLASDISERKQIIANLEIHLDIEEPTMFQRAKECGLEHF